MPLQTKRSTAWKALKAVESKLAVLSELQTRFDLLEEQYESDLRRLEAIAEAGVRLDQLKEERCPICGALAEHQHHEHPNASPAPADVSQACKAEAAKTSKLLQDLQTTRAANASEIEQLQATRDTRQAELDAISAVAASMKRVGPVALRREFCGHGIGAKFHEEPQVLHYGRPNTGIRLESGMVFTIEPMINAGKAAIRTMADGWIIVTKDHSLSAQWEHTILVTETSYEVLTVSEGTRPKPDWIR